MSQAAIIAVDGGNSKAELVLAGRDGRRLAFVRGGTISHQVVGWEAGIAQLRRLVAAARDEARLARSSRPAKLGVFCLAGADSRLETARLAGALRAEEIAEQVVVLNDSRAALRAGSPSGWGVAVICGAGVNAICVAPDGRVAGFPALGPLSGDWGGGMSLGDAALTAALRGRDGRGARTLLEQLVPAHFGLSRPSSVMWAIYHGRIRQEALRDLSPVVFAAAMDGDAVARAIVDHLADELATMATVTLRRLRLLRRSVDVVLAGGVMQTRDESFFTRFEEQLHRHAPGARTHRLSERPVVGAALLALDRLPHPRIAEARLRRELGERAPTVVRDR
jgi:N-acetylglucosamine kinase-like BadF-type ATPase